jgi:hypothetical protein
MISINWHGEGGNFSEHTNVTNHLCAVLHEYVAFSLHKFSAGELHFAISLKHDQILFVIMPRTWRPFQKRFFNSLDDKIIADSRSKWIQYCSDQLASVSGNAAGIGLALLLSSVGLSLPDVSSVISAFLQVIYMS